MSYFKRRIKYKKKNNTIKKAKEKGKEEETAYAFRSEKRKIK